MRSRLNAGNPPISPATRNSGFGSLRATGIRAYQGCVVMWLSPVTGCYVTIESPRPPFLPRNVAIRVQPPSTPLASLTSTRKGSLLRAPGSSTTPRKPKDSKRGSPRKSSMQPQNTACTRQKAGFCHLRAPNASLAYWEQTELGGIKPGPRSRAFRVAVCCALAYPFTFDGWSTVPSRWIRPVVVLYRCHNNTVPFFLCLLKMTCVWCVMLFIYSGRLIGAGL
jgi:hypothetical protein